MQHLPAIAPRFRAIQYLDVSHLENHVILPPSEFITLKLTHRDKTKYQPLLDQNDTVYFQASGNEPRGWNCFYSSFLAPPGLKTTPKQFALAFHMAKRLNLPQEQKSRLLKGIVQTAFYDGVSLATTRIPLLAGFTPKPVQDYLQNRLVSTAMAGPLRASKQLQASTHLGDRVSFAEFKQLCHSARALARQRKQAIQDAVIALRQKKGL